MATTSGCDGGVLGSGANPSKAVAERFVPFYVDSLANRQDPAARRYRGRYLVGWDPVRKSRLARMRELGIVDDGWELSPSDGRAWDELDARQRDELDLPARRSQPLFDEGQLPPELVAAPRWAEVVVDQDGDGQLTRGEIEKAASWRVK